jgi:hypothetical protein
VGSIGRSRRGLAERRLRPNHDAAYDPDPLTRCL